MLSFLLDVRKDCETDTLFNGQKWKEKYCITQHNILKN